MATVRKAATPIESLRFALLDFRTMLEAFTTNCSQGGDHSQCPVVTTLLEALVKSIHTLLRSASEYCPKGAPSGLCRLSMSWDRASRNIPEALKSGSLTDDFTKGEIITLINNAIRLHHQLEPQEVWVNFLSDKDISFDDPNYWYSLRHARRLSE